MGTIRQGDLTIDVDDRIVEHIQTAVGHLVYEGQTFLLELSQKDGPSVAFLVGPHIPCHFRHGPVPLADRDAAVVAALEDSVRKTSGIMLGAIASLDTGSTAEMYDAIARNAGSDSSE